MRGIKIFNQANSKIDIRYGGSFLTLDVGESAVIYPNKKKIYISHSKNRSSFLRLVQYPDTLFKNRWVISFVICVCLDCRVNISTEKSLVVNERNYVFRDEVLFSAFSVNSSITPEHQFHQKNDRIKCAGLLLSTSMVYLVFSVFVFLAVLLLLTEEVSFIYIMALLIAGGLMIGAVRHFSKSFQFMRMDKNYQDIVNNSNIVIIQERKKLIIKYCPLEDLTSDEI
ncbi:MAG: hypothetical protein ACI4M3_01775 [Acutalibacteraceae bacterium]